MPNNVQMKKTSCVLLALLSSTLIQTCYGKLIKTSFGNLHEQVILYNAEGNPVAGVKTESQQESFNRPAHDQKQGQFNCWYTTLTPWRHKHLHLSHAYTELVYGKLKEPFNSILTIKKVEDVTLEAGAVIALVAPIPAILAALRNEILGSLKFTSLHSLRLCTFRCSLYRLIGDNKTSPIPENRRFELRISIGGDKELKIRIITARLKTGGKTIEQKPSLLIAATLRNKGNSGSIFLCPGTLQEAGNAIFHPMSAALPEGYSYVEWLPPEKQSDTCTEAAESQEVPVKEQATPFQKAQAAKNKDDNASYDEMESIIKEYEEKLKAEKVAATASTKQSSPEINSESSQPGGLTKTVIADSPPSSTPTTSGTTTSAPPPALSADIQKLLSEIDIDELTAPLSLLPAQVKPSLPSEPVTLDQRDSTEPLKFIEPLSSSSFTEQTAPLTGPTQPQTLPSAEDFTEAANDAAKALADIEAFEIETSAKRHAPPGNTQPENQTDLTILNSQSHSSNQHQAHSSPENRASELPPSPMALDNSNWSLEEVLNAFKPLSLSPPSAQPQPFKAPVKQKGAEKSVKFAPSPSFTQKNDWKAPTPEDMKRFRKLEKTEIKGEKIMTEC